ncbi:MAG: type III pantothenate kinase [Candidatus Electrothrix sp. GW3-4]|uniref:type III pantothenate kinase n=1 Tax=Candidatus Electrothrix sp. GW3-4 TaxID=3126740 RepID=UPI0030D1B35F
MIPGSLFLLPEQSKTAFLSVILATLSVEKQDNTHKSGNHINLLPKQNLMLLTVDVGNSHTVSGVFSGQDLLHQWRLKSDRDKTADELAIRYHSLFQMNGIEKEDITAFIVCSVVPTLETSWLNFAEKYLTGCSTPPISVSHKTNTGIIIRIENPAEVGADRIVNAVAAWQHYKTALLAIDFGTAVTFDCVSKKGEYLGGTIHPGIGISLDALAGKTAKLPRIDLNRNPMPVIGTNTVDAICSGMLHGFGGMIDRMTALLRQEMQQEDEVVNIIATGGMAEMIAPYCSSIKTIDPLLTLTGLRLIYELNRENHNGSA